MNTTPDLAIAAAAPAPQRATTRPTTQRHLILVNQPGWQSVGDLVEIATKVRRIDPTIATFVVPADVDDRVAREAAGKLPCLTVSFGHLGKFKPPRGKVYGGAPMGKFEQLRRLQAAGAPVPTTAFLTPELQLDPARWGEFVILKPADMASSSRGHGIQLMRTERVRYRAPADYPEGHPGRLAPMIVQRFVDTGPRLSYFRVLTLFDVPLYCQVTRSRVPRVSLAAPDEEIEAAMIASQSLGKDDQEPSYVYDADVIEAAKAAARAIPEVPLKGIDVVRDDRSGRPFVLEVNPGGNTWHFSSKFLAQDRAMRGPGFEAQRLAQFDAFATAAYALVARTRAEAA